MRLVTLRMIWLILRKLASSPRCIPPQSLVWIVLWNPGMVRVLTQAMEAKVSWLSCSFVWICKSVHTFYCSSFLIFVSYNYVMDFWGSLKKKQCVCRTGLTVSLLYLSLILLWCGSLKTLKERLSKHHTKSDACISNRWWPFAAVMLERSILSL